MKKGETNAVTISERIPEEIIVTPQVVERHGNSRLFLIHRILWLIGAILVIIVGVLVYNWVFSKPKIVYTTTTVERGDLENTVLSAGIVQPIKYVDVGAQTSGKLKSLKVKRGDRVEKGQDVYFTVLGQAQRWTGNIRQILPTLELINNVVFYDVLFDIENPKRELYIQMTAQVYIVLSQAKDVLLIPTAAVGNAGEGTKIKVRMLKEDGNMEIRAIKIGIKGEISTEVQEGLKENELVVIGEIKEKANSQSALSEWKGPR